MKPEHHHHDEEYKKRVPLWKWVLIITLIIAMPLFFSLYRNAQIQRALAPLQNQQPAHS